MSPNLLKVLLCLFTLWCATVGTMPTTSKTKRVRDCVVRMRKQKVMPVRRFCFERTFPLPFCFGLCRTTDNFMVNGKQITDGAECSCCQPKVFKELEVKFICATNSGKKAIHKEKIKVPLECSCSRCAVGGYSSQKEGREKLAEDKLLQILL